MNESGSSPSTPGTPMTQCPTAPQKSFASKSSGESKRCINALHIFRCYGERGGARERERELANIYLLYRYIISIVYTTRLKLYIYKFRDSLFTMYCIVSISYDQTRCFIRIYPTKAILQCFPLLDLSFDVKPVIQVTLVAKQVKDQTRNSTTKSCQISNLKSYFQTWILVLLFILIFLASHACRRPSTLLVAKVPTQITC